MHPFSEATPDQFVTIGKISDWQDRTAREVKVHKKPMSVVRMGDRFFALNSICPHMGGPLSCGDLREGKLYCPWHEWGFDVETGKCPNGHRVERYQVRVQGDEVQVGWIIHDEPNLS